jgi:plasmid stability protein
LEPACDWGDITVTPDDETYRRARTRAAELSTSVSAAVREFLTGFAAGGSRFEQLQRDEEALRAQIECFSGADRLPRDAIHDREP